MQQFSDIALFKLLKDDRTDAFTELYNRYWDKLYIIATHILHSPQDAEEAVHDVFLKIWNQRKTIAVQHTVNQYLAAAVKYEVLSRLRKAYRREQLLQKMSQPSSAQYDAGYEMLREKELMQELESSVQQLPEKCRIVFRLSREKGYTAREIAHELNISVHTAESHLSKALRLIRKRLQRTLLFFWI